MPGDLAEAQLATLFAAPRVRVGSLERRTGQDVEVLRAGSAGKAEPFRRGAPPEHLPALARGADVLNPDPSLEQQKRFWIIGAPWEGPSLGLTTAVAHSGRWAADLSCDETSLVCLSQSVGGANETHVLPDTRYELTFWALATNGPGKLLTNLYAGAGYDFPQIELTVPVDGQWHRITTTLQTGPLLADDPRHRWFRVGEIRAGLRLFTLGWREGLFVDDIELRALD